MTRDEVFQKLEEQVKYLQQIIAPDDIYLFAEQTFVSAVFFLQYFDMAEEDRPECYTEFFNLYKNNILKLLELQHNKVPGVRLELGLNWEEKEFFEKLSQERQNLFQLMQRSFFFYEKNTPCDCGENKFHQWNGKYKCTECQKEYDP